MMLQQNLDFVLSFFNKSPRQTLLDRPRLLEI